MWEARRCFAMRPLVGRGLINAQPKADRGNLDEGEVIGGEFVIASGDATVSLDLDLVEEPFDQVTRPVETGTEAVGLLRFCTGGMLA